MPQPLWAPWRMEFISGPKPSGCFLCEAAHLDPTRDAEHYVLTRTPLAFALLNLFPYNNGHLMIAPRDHVGDYTELGPKVTAEIDALTQRAVKALRATMNPEGFNLGINLGKVAGAGVADHVHQHVVPRWNGDTNFMPVLGDVKVMSEHLRATYDKLRPAFDSQP